MAPGVSHSDSVSAPTYKTYSFKKLYKQLGYRKYSHFTATADEILALNTYSEKFDSYYRDINMHLREYPNTDYDWDSISPEQAQKIAFDLNKYILKTPKLPPDLILFRGSAMSFRNNRSYKINEEIIEKAFLSTSTSLKTAEFFATKLCQEKDTPDLKAIHMLYSSKQPLLGILINQREGEVLLASGLKLRIMSIKSQGPFDIYLTQICDQVCATNAPKQIQKFHSKIMLNPCKD